MQKARSDVKMKKKQIFYLYDARLTDVRAMNKDVRAMNKKQRN
jgi:hypothetical protein